MGSPHSPSAPAAADPPGENEKAGDNARQPNDASAEIPAATVNHALALSYDGTPFCGWQIQPNGESVQGRLEAAFRTILRVPVKVTGSGRTDAGVHAIAQVANVHLPPGLDLGRLRGSLNGLAGPEISVRKIVPVPPRFHARHRARGKHYQYRIFNHPHPPVFERGRCWWLKSPLDLEAMRAAAAGLTGRHDFSAFRAIQCEASHPVRTLERLEISPGEGPDDLLRIDLEADAFLQHMARIIAGTLVAVGQGKLPPGEVPAILASRHRERAPGTAPAAGLHLMRVDYDLAEFPQLKGLAGQ